MMKRGIFQLIFASQLFACVTPATPATGATEESAIASEDLAGRLQLRISLYPWIPDPDSFLAFIEADFEAKNPDIDLVVRPLVKSYDWEPEFVADLAYEPDKTAAALTDKTNADFQDIVEIDTLTLGVLAEHNALAPFRVKGLSFLPFATDAGTWHGQPFGVPHWTCGYFVISENSAIRHTHNAEDLAATLDSTGTDRVGLAGALDGSWDSISVYLDGFRDTYPSGDMQQALQQPQIDPVVAEHFQHLRSVCIKDGVNYCGADAVDLFATGGANGLIGFSERLNPILAHPAKTVGELHIASATLGGGDAPVGFVDALVLSPQCSSERCRKAAQRFANYYVSDETFESSLMALDTAARVPRYLLPSTTSALEFGLVGQDRLYAELKGEIRKTTALPNVGVPEAREAAVIRPQMQAALGL
jgi:thiamine pyridinylase